MTDRETLQLIEWLLADSMEADRAERITPCGRVADALARVRALLAEPEPTPIRGRWWLVMLPNGAPYAIRPTRKSAEEYARNLGREYGVVEVVPVPGEQAIERVARALYIDDAENRPCAEVVAWSRESDAYKERWLDKARAVLAAALEQSER